MDNIVVCRCAKLCDQLGLTLKTYPDTYQLICPQKSLNFKTNKPMLNGLNRGLINKGLADGRNHG